MTRTWLVSAAVTGGGGRGGQLKEAGYDAVKPLPVTGGLTLELTQPRVPTTHPSRIRSLSLSCSLPPSLCQFELKQEAYLPLLSAGSQAALATPPSTHAHTTARCLHAQCKPEILYAGMLCSTFLSPSLCLPPSLYHSHSITNTCAVQAADPADRDALLSLLRGAAAGAAGGPEDPSPTERGHHAGEHHLRSLRNLALTPRARAVTYVTLPTLYLVICVKYSYICGSV